MSTEQPTTTPRNNPTRSDRSHPSSSAWLRDHPWIWAYIGSAALWIALSVAAGHVSVGVLGAVFALAPFLVLVGIGQMFVISLGNGHTDLTIPNVISLTAFAATQITASTGSITFGILFSFAIGLAVAAMNSGIILGLRVPPIVATLAAGLIIQSATSVTADASDASPSAALAAFTHARPLGISILGMLVIVVALIAAAVLRRTVYGTWVLAIGQSDRAAMLTGVKTRSTIVTSYAISAVLAATAGVLLGAFNSPDVALGDPYLLNSIAVVVIGGTLISGGRSNLPGIWGAGLFLLLLDTLLNSLNITVAAQDIVKGLLIVLVLAVVGAEKRR